MDGIYTQSPCSWGLVANTRTSGTPEAWIALIYYPGTHPKIRSANWQGIKLNGAASWVIQGFTTEGNRDNVTLAQAATRASTSEPTKCADDRQRVISERTSRQGRR